MSDGTATCIDIILAIILPPLGVFFKFGCGVSQWQLDRWFFVFPLRSYRMHVTVLWFICVVAAADDSCILYIRQVEFWICLVLTFFGYLPGIIYAVWAITK